MAAALSAGLWASAQIPGAEPAEADPVNAPIAEMVANIAFTARADAGHVNVQWRPLGTEPGVGADVFRVENVGPGKEVPYAGLKSAVFAFGGTDAALNAQLELARSLGAFAVERQTEIILVRLSPSVEVLAQVDTAETLAAALDTLAPQLAPSADTARTLPDAFAFAASNPGRTAFLAPADAFPADEDVLISLAEASVAREVYLFPIAPEPSDTALRALASLTGGQVVLPSEGRPAPQTFADFLGGGELVFDLPPTWRYRLPGEAEREVALTVSAPGETSLFPLARVTPQLGWAGAAARLINPTHWVRWFGEPGRFTFAWLGLISNLAFAGLVLLGVRRLSKPAARPIATAAQQNAPPPEAAAPEPVAFLKVRKSIGRKWSCDYVLTDPSVSRVHAVLHQDGPRAWISDEGSANGTFIFKDEQWQRIDEAPVTRGDRLRFGQSEVTVKALFDALEIVLSEAAPSEGEGPTLQRFQKPRRNPITGKIEEGAP
ncbi:MAG: FHA domain-containing protein [Pseudomonadota bacterium]